MFKDSKRIIMSAIFPILIIITLLVSVIAVLLAAIQLKSY
jgi:hypothetical protein